MPLSFGIFSMWMDLGMAAEWDGTLPEAPSEFA